MKERNNGPRVLRVGQRVRLIGGRMKGKVIASGDEVSHVQWDNFIKQYHPNNQLKRLVPKRS